MQEVDEAPNFFSFLSAHFDSVAVTFRLHKGRKAMISIRRLKPAATTIVICSAGAYPPQALILAATNFFVQKLVFQLWIISFKYSTSFLRILPLSFSGNLPRDSSSTVISPLYPAFLKIEITREWSMSPS